MPLAQASLLLLLSLATSGRRSVQSLDLETSGAAGEGSAAAHGAAESDAEGALLADQVREGSLFLGRFRMKQALWARASERDGRGAFVDFPEAMEGRFTKRGKLAAGSFGETWSAYDEELRRQVAVKLYYVQERRRRFHLTWKLAAGDRKKQKDLLDAAGECLAAQRMQLDATADPEGASRIMQCYEDHVACDACRKGEASGTSTSGHKVTREQPLYQVLEDCAGEGGKPLDEWRKEVMVSADYLDRALALFKQMLQGLAYLTAPERGVKWVHHDLKPANVVVKRIGGAEYVKIIDFGAASEATAAKAAGPSIPMTVAYAAPEYWSGKLQFYRTRPWSWDAYSAGCMLFWAVTGEPPLGRLLELVPRELRKEYEEEFRGAPYAVWFALKEKVEPLKTKDWGKDEAAVKDAQRLLLSQRGSSSDYAEILRQDGLVEQLVAMLSSVPRQRPTPQQVLGSPFLRQRKTAPDPDFDAAAAQARAARAEEASGGAGEEDAKAAAKEAALEASLEAALEAGREPSSIMGRICGILSWLPNC